MSSTRSKDDGFDFSMSSSSTDSSSPLCNSLIVTLSCCWWSPFVDPLDNLMAAQKPPRWISQTCSPCPIDEFSSSHRAYGKKIKRKTLLLLRNIKIGCCCLIQWKCYRIKCFEVVNLGQNHKVSCFVCCFWMLCSNLFRHAMLLCLCWTIYRTKTTSDYMSANSNELRPCLNTAHHTSWHTPHHTVSIHC